MLHHFNRVVCSEILNNLRKLITNVAPIAINFPLITEENKNPALFWTMEEVEILCINAGFKIKYLKITKGKWLNVVLFEK